MFQRCFNGFQVHTRCFQGVSREFQEFWGTPERFQNRMIGLKAVPEGFRGLREVSEGFPCDFMVVSVVLRDVTWGFKAVKEFQERSTGFEGVPGVLKEF